MKILLKDIKEGIPLEVNFDVHSPWVKEILMNLNERPIPGENKTLSLPTFTPSSLTVRRMENVYEAKGTIELPLILNCSRCATRYAQPIRNQFSLYFTRDRVEAGLTPEHSSKESVKNIHPESHSFDETEITYLSSIAVRPARF